MRGTADGLYHQHKHRRPQIPALLHFFAAGRLKINTLATMDGIITRAHAEDISDGSSDDDDDDDTDYLKDIYGHYGGSLIPSAKSEQNSST